MKTASLKEIKTELENVPPAELLQLCLRLTKFKKENKELLSYLLFESTDEEQYVKGVQEVLAELFLTVNTKNIYFAKKTIRKIIRTANRYIKYSSAETTESDILIFVCEKINGLGINLKKNTALLNLYLSLIKRIKKAVGSMHEDMQYDYNKAVENLSVNL